MAATITKSNQTVYKEREREGEITLPIYTGSLNPELHPVPRTTTGFPLVTNHRLQYTTPQRGDLDTTRTTHPLCLHTTLVRTPSDLTGLHISQLQKKKLIQESERNILHLDLQESHSS